MHGKFSQEFSENKREEPSFSFQNPDEVRRFLNTEELKKNTN